MSSLTPSPLHVAAAYRSSGPRVSTFIERHCVHGEGDYFGKPFLLRHWQRRIINRIFELRYDDRSRRWRRRYRRVLLGLPSGSGKTELLAALGLYMLVSGEHTSPLIPVAAASKEQANLIFGAARIMCEESKTLARFTETGVDAITLRGAPGRMYRVAAADGTNEGQRPSCFLADEFHEWSESKNTYAVISKGTAKRVDSLQIAITTAGYDLDTLCGRQYEYGKRVNAGEVNDPTFLMVWFEAPADADADDPAVWLETHPAAGDFLTLEALEEKRRELPDSLFRRYFLNQWTAAATSWLPAGAWARCRLEGVPTPAPWREPIVIRPGETEEEAEDAERIAYYRREIEARFGALGFDRSLPIHVGWDASTRYDSTAIVAVQKRVTLGADEALEERLLVLSRIWERPLDKDGRPLEGWLIPIEDIKAYLWALADVARVEAVQFDPAFITWEADKLAASGLPMREFPQGGVRMGIASQALYEIIVSGILVHNGDPSLARHIGAAVAKQQRTGSAAWRLVKGDAKRKMDATIALAMALWSLLHPWEEPAAKKKKAPSMAGDDYELGDEATGNP